MLQMLVWTLALVMDPETEEALKAFAREYSSPVVARRAAAVTDLSRLPNPVIRSRLGTLLLTDEEEIRIAAATALGGFAAEKDKVSALLISALPPNAKFFSAQAAILGALGKLGDESALPTLLQFVESKDAKDGGFLVAKAALQAAGVFKSPGCIEPLIELARRLDKVLKNGNGRNSAQGGTLGLPGGAANDPPSLRARALVPVLLRSLQAITGEKWSTLVEWSIWWDRHPAPNKPQK